MKISAKTILIIFTAALLLLGGFILPLRRGGEVGSAHAATINSSLTGKGGSLTSGLVGWWTFDGADISGTDVYDKSGQARTATMVGGAAKTVGKLGQSLKFNGSNGYTTASGFSELGTSNRPYTIAGWFKAAPGEQSGNLVHIASQSNGAGWCVTFVALGAGYIRAYGYNGNVIEAVDTSLFTTGRWYQFATTWDSTNGLRLFVNGNLAKSTPQTTYAASGSPDYVFTGFFYNNCVGEQGWFDGSIDDVRVYSRALSAAEIKQLYNTGQSQQNKSKTTDSLTRGLTGWWTMDGADVSGATILDKSGNGLNGTEASATKVAGKIGQAYKFNGGTSDIALPAFTTGATLTMSCWFKTTSPDQRTCFNNYDASSGVYFGISSGKLFSYSTNSSPVAFFGNTSATDDKWHLGVYTLDGTKGRFYLDGVLDKEIDQTRTSVLSTGHIGSCNGNGNWIGSVDDVRVYSRALSAVEVKQLYNLGQSTVNKSAAVRVANSGLIGWWTFDGMDTYGTQVYDKSGRGNTGTSSGGVTKVAGKLGQAYKFDGVNGKVESSTITGWSNTAITFAFWAKQLAAPSNYSQVLGDKGSAGAVYVFPNDGRFFGQLSLTNNSNVYSGYVAPGTGWNYWALTWQSGDKLKLYKNGVLASQSGDAYTDTIQNFTGIYIGYYSGVNYFNGYIDDARVYNRALSAAEVKQLYNGGK